MHTLPQGKLRLTLAEVKALLAEDRDFPRSLVQAVLQELLEAEMTGAVHRFEIPRCGFMRRPGAARAAPL
jgi:hypothetical protein